MTNTERIQANNAELREAIQMAEDLPDAGGGAVVKPIIEPLEVIKNGTYTAPNGVDGYSPVVVDVPSGGADILENLTSLYFFFWRNHNMKLLPAILEMDWANVTNVQYTFQENTTLTEFNAPESMKVTLPHGMFMNCTSVVRVSGLDRAIPGTVITDLFKGCTSLVDAGTINFGGVRFVSRTFTGCVALEEIRIVGQIDVSVSFADSGLLSDESIQSIIDALADRTGATALTLTLHATVGGKLTAEQKAAITAKNWTLVY